MSTPLGLERDEVVGRHRPSEEVALPGADLEGAHDAQLVRRLDPFGDDRGAPAAGRGPAARRRPTSSDSLDGAALDERQVDLHDVELELAQEAQAGVARPRRRPPRGGSRPLGRR